MEKKEYSIFIDNNMGKIIPLENLDEELNTLVETIYLMEMRMD